MATSEAKPEFKGKYILAVDVGGTKVAVGLYQQRSPQILSLVIGQRYETRHHKGLEEILLDFTSRLDDSQPLAVGIGVAGPVLQRRADLTNLAWRIDADALQQRLDRPVYLANDLEVHAHGIPYADTSKTVVLNAGVQQAGNAALIAAGTGLGEAIMHWDGKRHLPAASEGSHASFAPISAEDVELLVFLQRQHKHVSWERVVSGLDGFRNLYDFLNQTQRIKVPPSFQAQVEGMADIGAPLLAAWQAGEAFAEQVLRRFVRLYGAEAGNLALKALATGGVYISGGITGRILPLMQDGEFLEAFAAKGRFRPLLMRTPVTVLLDEELALKGAAALALHQ